MRREFSVSLRHAHGLFPQCLRSVAFCKVNLLLNILRQRADGFHELETVLHPVDLCDLLAFGARDRAFT